MGSLAKPEFSHDIFPYIRVYKDGTFERLVGTDVVPAGFDPKTGVLSKDTVIAPSTGVSARIYRPSIIPKHHKLPLVLYFHGGAFCISSASDPAYHRALNLTVERANAVAVSVDYRLAPEHPLPAAHEDCFDALKWVASHRRGDGPEDWLRDFVDFDKVFLVGDSAGANIAHHVGIRVGLSKSDPDTNPGTGIRGITHHVGIRVGLSKPDPDADLVTGIRGIAHNVGIRVGLSKPDPDTDPGLGIRGIAMVNPYFWGKDPIGAEAGDGERKRMVDVWWNYVCPSGEGCDDPMINPFAGGAPGLGGLGCERVMVLVAERDILRERGKVYYEKLVESDWGGSAEIVEVEGEDHVFHIFDPDCDKALALFKRLASFINQEQQSH